MVDCSNWFSTKNCNKLEILLKKSIYLRSFNTFKSKATFQLEKTLDKVYRVCQDIENVISNLKNEEQDVFETKRRKIIKNYLEPRAGPTQILKDFINRF